MAKVVGTKPTILGATVFLVCCMVSAVAILLAKTPSPHRPDSIHQFFHDGEKDPPVNSLLPVKLAEAESDPRHSILVIYAGSCSSCSLESTQDFDYSVFGYERVFVIFEAGAHEIEESLRGMPGAQKPLIKYVSDPNGELREFFNPTWVPRGYYYIGGRLSEMQMSPNEVMRHAKKLR